MVIMPYYFCKIFMNTDTILESMSHSNTIEMINTFQMLCINARSLNSPCLFISNINAYKKNVILFTQKSICYI